MQTATEHPGSAPAPINVFQRLVRQWDRIHPYNAAQVLKLAGSADAARLGAAWQTTLEALGLGRVKLNGPRVSHHVLNGDAERYAIAVGDGQVSLCEFLSSELNRPFDDENEPPFRPFIHCEGGHHYAGIIYHHWVADSVSIRMVLREWFYRIYAPGRARTRPLKHPANGYWSIFGAGRANWGWTDGLLTSVRWSSRNRRVARIVSSGYGDFSARFDLHPLGEGLVDPLLSFARSNGATLNDLFLAVGAEVCNRYVPLARTRRRTDLAMGTIVDLRAYSKQDLSDTFGLFLGFTNTLFRPDDLVDFPRLLRRAAAQSILHKQTGLPLSSPVRMLAALAVGKYYGRKRLIEFYRKRVPLAGGISNVNLNRSWAAEFHPAPLLDYIRVSPTGPMMPLVFTPTTLGKQMHFGLTYRPSIIAPEKAGEMAREFAGRLRELADAGN